MHVDIMQYYPMMITWLTVFYQGGGGGGGNSLPLVCEISLECLTGFHVWGGGEGTLCARIDFV